ncbi:MAG: hypothetical protein V1799_15665 [bacterium]
MGKIKLKLKISGLGRKRPQVNIPISLIELDNQNPRLPDDYQGGSQLDIMQVLFREFDLEELAYSMAENGYFDEEPIVVVPKKISWNLDLISDYSVEEMELKLNKLIADNKITFTVVEGNRRTATAKLLVADEWKQRIKVGADFPTPRNKEVLNDLLSLPSICYSNRNEVSPYLGVRHIAGIMKWDAFAKARYISTMIEAEADGKKKNIETGVREVQRQIGDRSDTIKRQYLYYKILKQAQDETSFDIRPVTKRFSLITLALNYPSIREFIGVSSYKDIDVTKYLVPPKKINNLETLLTWIYGNGKDKQPILTDSRNISKLLAPVLADREATEYLINHGNLTEAYERSGGDKIFLKKKLNDAARNLSNALTVAYKYRKEKEVLSLIDNCSKTLNELIKMVS